MQDKKNKSKNTLQYVQLWLRRRIPATETAELKYKGEIQSLWMTDKNWI